MFSTPETSVHVRDKNRDISPLGREEDYGGKDLEKRWVLRQEWKTLWDTPTTDLGAESEPGNGESTLRWPTDKEREQWWVNCQLDAVWTDFDRIFSVDELLGAEEPTNYEW